MTVTVTDSWTTAEIKLLNIEPANTISCDATYGVYFLIVFLLP